MRIVSVSGTMGRLAACVEVASILLVSSAALAAPQLVLVNAKVFTADPALPYAQAVAIEDGRILAVGSNEQVRALTGPNTRILDAGGRLVTPGLTEAHVHLGVALPTPPLAVNTVTILPSVVGLSWSVVVAARMRHDTSRERRQATVSAGLSNTAPYACVSA